MLNQDAVKLIFMDNGEEALMGKQAGPSILALSSASTILGDTASLASQDADRGRVLSGLEDSDDDNYFLINLYK